MFIGRAVGSIQRVAVTRNSTLFQNITTTTSGRYKKKDSVTWH